MTRFVLSAALALCLPACATAPLSQPDVAVPATFGADQAAADSSARIDAWWLLFGDPQLVTLVEQALTSAPDARTALARLQEAQAVRRGALTSFGPQGNPTGSISRSDTHVSGLPAGQAALLGAGKSASLSGAFNVSWEVDLFGRQDATRQAANADLAAARFVYEGARLSLAADVATQLFAARGLAAQIVEAQETLRIAQDLARVGQIRARVGLGSESDAARLDTQSASAQADLVNLRAQFATTRRALLVLLGRGTEALEVVPIDAALPVAPRPPALTPADVMI
ncbi:MAG: TolC family protein, partial [bacterium]|nr:TolC family protein [bacterium]